MGLPLVESLRGLPPNAEMWPALALWAVAAVVVPTCEATLSHRRLQAHSTQAGRALRRTRLLRQSQEPVAANVDAAVRARSEVAKFGPANCISTWRNEDGHCEVETQCKDEDISKYAVKFICIDAGGEKVRHVFAMGSFDPEEQFDTLIECNKCLAEKQETIQIISDIPPAKKGTKKSAKAAKLEEEPEQLGGAPLAELRDEVKELEVFMMNTSAELQKLNAKVYSKDFLPKVTLPNTNIDKVGKTAAAKATAVKFLVGQLHHQEQELLHVEVDAARVVKEHQRHLENYDDEPPRKALKVAARKAAGTSLTGALKTAEERDEAESPQQPETSPMMLSAAGGAEKKPKPLVVALPAKAEDGDEDGEDEDDGDLDDVQEDESSESSIPQSADDFESQEEEKDGDISALQQNDDDDDSASDDDADAGDEDASE